MLTKNKWFVVLSLLIIGVMLLTACGGAAPAEEEAAPAEEGGCQLEDEDGVVIFGGPLHLSGWMAFSDGPPRQGAITAVRVLNERGGIAGCPVEWIELDAQTDVAVLGNVALQLYDQGTDAFITPCDFDFGAAAGQVAQEKGIVAMSTCASSPLYGSIGLGDMNFTMSYWTTTMGSAEAEFAYKQGWRKAYLLTDQSIEYCTSMGEYTEETWKHLGGEVVAHDGFQQSDPDVSAQIQRILELQPDVIIMSSYMPGMGAVVRQIRGAGIDTPMVGGDNWDTEEFWGALGEDMANNIWYATFSWVYDDSVIPGMGEFIEEFEKDWDEPPTMAYQAMGWDSVMMIAAAMEQAGSTEGAKVSDALEEIEFDGLSGTTSFTDAEEGHRPIKEAFFNKLENGKPIFLERFVPAYEPEV